MASKVHFLFLSESRYGCSSIWLRKIAPYLTTRTTISDLMIDRDDLVLEIIYKNKQYYFWYSTQGLKNAQDDYRENKIDGWYIRQFYRINYSRSYSPVAYN